MAARFLLSPPPLISSGPTGDPQPISGSGKSRNQSQTGLNLPKNLNYRNLDGMTIQNADTQNNQTAESLTCGGCGNDGPNTLADAVIEGWTRLAANPDGLSWNFVGECPECHTDQPAEKVE